MTDAWALGGTLAIVVSFILGFWIGLRQRKQMTIDEIHRRVLSAQKRIDAEARFMEERAQRDREWVEAAKEPIE